MANSILIDVIKSVTKTSFSSAFTAIAIIRLGMMAYPEQVVVSDTQAGHQVEGEIAQIAEAPVEGPSAKTIAKDAPRIVFGQNSIESLKKRN